MKPEFHLKIYKKKFRGRYMVQAVSRVPATG